MYFFMFSLLFDTYLEVLSEIWHIFLTRITKGTSMLVPRDSRVWKLAFSQTNQKHTSFRHYFSLLAFAKFNLLPMMHRSQQSGLPPRSSDASRDHTKRNQWRNLSQELIYGIFSSMFSILNCDLDQRQWSLGSDRLRWTHTNANSRLTHTFSGFSNACHSALFWTTALKLGCITKFDMLFHVMGFNCLVDEIKLMLMSG